MNDKTRKETCGTCKYFEYGQLYEKDLISYDTLHKCCQYPKHVGIVDISNHWCGEYHRDENVTLEIYQKRVEESRELIERRRQREL